ncbi:hypothetical protein GCM10009846_24260 [Agrococcus versicolor]|uniref:Serine protease n=2 Tax=Agrococcus versicolor TaxID=501482 RepID=A0ABN3AW43_9MICO
MDPRVTSIHADEMLTLDGSPSNDYLDVETMWAQAGGVEGAGEGVVVGVLDTGIAPENPLFAGEPLGTDATTGEPYLDAEGQILFQKGDGETFTGTCETGPQFTADMCSTKIVGAQIFLDGFGADEIGGEGVEVASPRDLDGHGSHTASTAAGNFDVPVTTEGGQDIGTMSGVAPEARIAVYKVCWSGNDPDPAVTTDDSCAGSDLFQAIEAATADGVDVINFSIGGGSASSVLDPYDVAFLGAAAAGVFTSASAGNSGPNPTTLDHASPWYSTVANTTIPNYEATIALEDGTLIPGASVTVDMSADAEPFSGPLVYAGDNPATGATAADAALCLPGSLATVPEGTVVLCDRGNNARAEKSEVVAAAGGAGMVLANVTPGSIDLDDHAVPTIHVDAQYRAQLLAVAQADPQETVTFTAGNTSGIETAAPIVAASSSRGPVNVDGNDVIKPDIAAPGTGIIAAGPNAEGADPTFRFLSGTSMAAPHVAGLAAVYLGVNPLATPAEVKSALMTTATDTVNADGTVNQDWFAQGAGFVEATSFLDAGVYYANGTEDWYGYLRGIGYELPETWVGSAIDPSDLNIPSIGIGALAGSQTVTRTLTALEAGSYTVSVDAPEGTTAVVSPTTLDFAAAGDERSYTVTFTTTTAPVGAFTTGSLTWTSTEHTARSPIAVFPVALDAPEWVEGTGTIGSTPITVLPGQTGAVDVLPTGLGKVEEILAGEGNEGDAVESETFEVPEDAAALYFELDGEDGVSDLDLAVLRVNAAGQVLQTYTAATAATDETLLIEDPTAGTYVAIVDVYSVEGGGATPYALDQVTIGGASDDGQFTAEPSTVQGTVAVPTTFDVSWRGLDADSSYIGFVDYSTDPSQRTFVRVTTGVESVPAADRIEGANRYEVAVNASQLSHPDGAEVVYLASGEVFADGLSAGPAAVQEDAPLLLTQGATLTGATLDEIERLAPSEIVIVGGPASVSAAVETALGGLADQVTRIGGADRYEVSRNIADRAFADIGAAFLVTGATFADALTAGPAAASIDAPVLLVQGSQQDLDAATLETLDELGVSRTYVAGGPASVSNAIVGALVTEGLSPQRLSGADRYEVGIAVNQAFFSAPVSDMFLASGQGFPDALSGSALAGSLGAPLYVVPGTCVPSAVIGENLRLDNPAVTLLGGPATLSPAVQAYAVCS